MVAMLLVIVAGCGSNPVKKNTEQAENKIKAPVMVDTVYYIPQRVRNPETGQLIPYQAMTNPYLVSVDRIDMALVTAYVSARRAFQSGAYRQAKQHLENLTSKDKRLSGPWVMLGDISRKNDKPKEAVSYYNKAIEINKNNVNVYIRLAKTYRELGQFVFAKNTYQQALAVWKDFPEAHLNLAILYDLYLNESLLSQRHLEAYLFLKNGRDKIREGWLREIQQRTGKEIKLKAEIKKAISATTM